MKKFNKLFVASKTLVMISGEYNYSKVKSVSDCRQWITVEGYEGSFQRIDIVSFTNKSEAPNVEKPSKYFSDQYGSVYERGDNENIFIGKLNGKSLKSFIANI